MILQLSPEESVRYFADETPDGFRSCVHDLTFRIVRELQATVLLVAIQDERETTIVAVSPRPGGGEVVLRDRFGWFAK